MRLSLSVDGAGRAATDVVQSQVQVQVKNESEEKVGGQEQV